MGLLVTASTYAQQMGSPLDFVNSQLAEQMKNQVRAMSDPDLVKARAQLQRKYYEALIEAGFSKEEAMKIIIATAQGDANWGPCYLDKYCRYKEGPAFSRPFVQIILTEY